MIVTIDIGNTTTTFGTFERGRLRSHVSIATRPSRSPSALTRELKALTRTRHLPLTRATQIILCSVVPRMTSTMASALRTLEPIPIHIVGRDLHVPLANRYRHPEHVGQDRLVGAYAAWCEFGSGATRGRPAGRSPSRARQRPARETGRDVIVADFGTAITLDIVSKAGEYLGGVIAPGLEISRDALATKTALLPKVQLREPRELLGRNTPDSIRAGLLYGSAALCDGLVSQLKRRYAPRALVVATGGSSALIVKHARTIDHLRPHLVLDGLSWLSSLSLSKGKP